MLIISKYDLTSIHPNAIYFLCHYNTYNGCTPPLALGVSCYPLEIFLPVFRFMVDIPPFKDSLPNITSKATAKKNGQ